MSNIKQKFIAACNDRGEDPVKVAEKMMRDYIREPDVDGVAVMEYLNEKTGKKFRVNAPGNIKWIRARARDGYTLEDFKKVIDNKMRDPFFQEKDLMRPDTLFRPSHFDAYLNEAPERTLETALFEAAGLMTLHNESQDVINSWIHTIRNGQYPERPPNTPYSKIEPLEEEALKLLRKT